MRLGQNPESQGVHQACTTRAQPNRFSEGESC